MRGNWGRVEGEIELNPGDSPCIDCRGKWFAEHNCACQMFCDEFLEYQKEKEENS